MTNHATELETVGRDEASAAFFDAAAEGILVVPRCDACGHCSALTSQTCTVCGNTELTWSEASRKAQVISWAVLPTTGGQGAEHRLMVIVELDEGPWLETRLFGADPATVHIGQPVTIEFAVPEGGEALPIARA